MRQALFLLVIIVSGCSILRAQQTTLVNQLAPVPSPTVAPAAKPVKPAKPVVNVSKRFSESLPPEKLRAARVSRFETAPQIDGKLDDAIWQTAQEFKDFFQTSPGDNIAASKPTIVKIGYDAENLYFAFHCFDEPDKIRATVARRDNVFGEDNVRVHLDTFNDQRRAYVIGFNPFGIQQDGLYTEGQGTDYSFDIVMESKGEITADGYTVEARVPFKSFRYEAGKNKLWGIHLSRNIDRLNDELDSWMPVDPNITGYLNQEGKITGLEDIKIERTVELVPSVTLRQVGERVEDQNSPIGQRFLQNGVKNDIGLTAKFVLLPNVTLDAAINPDFAEVEADAPAVTANQRFPLFFSRTAPVFSRRH